MKLRGKKRPAESNILLVRRELIPKGEGRTNWALWFSVTLMQMLLLELGLCLFLVSGFSLNAAPGLLYGGIVLECLIFTVFYYDNWLTGARVAGAAALTLATTVTVLFQQQAFVSGFSQLACAVLEQMNSTYNGDYMIPLVTEVPKNVSIFLLLIFVPITAYLGAFVVKSTDTMLVGIFVFPVVALLMLLSASPSTLSMVFLLLGILSVLASDRVGYRRSLWGKKDSWEWKQNWLRRQKISAVSAACICLAGLVLMVPSVVVLMPGLSIPLAHTVPFAESVEGHVAEAILSYMPEIYKGEMSAPISTFGGGVSDGSLNDTAGYLISGVEDLSLSCTKKPQETIYLRGFIGGSYEQNQWKQPEERVFSSAAANWSTEGDASIYLYNLPFLRMLYEENEAGVGSSMAELTVVRLNANDQYTYTPYGSYLNEYYQVSGGDGGVNGQSVQDDIFSFYFRSDQMATLEEEFFLQNESALDRLERSYSAYAKEHYRAVPEGFEELQEQCDAAKLSDADVEEIIAYVQSYLTQNYTYSLALSDIPEGKDAIAYFLNESKTGCSPHFASAATIMFRMLGIPARYVVGYAASESLFTAQSDGTYTAVLQSDNAHAWTEIYISGTGWLPVETTPGQLGMVQEVEFYGSQLSPENTETAEGSQTQDTQPPTPDEPQQPRKRFPVGLLLLLAVAAAAVFAGWAVWRRRVRDLGLDRKKPAALRVRFIFAAYYRRLVKAGMPRQVESTSEEFVQWIEKLDPELGQENFQRMMCLVLQSAFGRQTIRETDVNWMRRIYRAAKNRIRKPPNTNS